MDTLEVLRSAREIVAENWSQGGGGLGLHVGCGGPCMWLAINRYFGWESAERALLRVVGGSFKDDIFRFNDTHTHAEVLTAFDRAIAIEEAKAQEFDTGAAHALLAIAEREAFAERVTVAA